MRAFAPPRPGRRRCEPARRTWRGRRCFADSPVELVSLATSDHFPHSDGAKDWVAMTTVDGIRLFTQKFGKAPSVGATRTQAPIEAVEAYLHLSHDVGTRLVRALPNNWPPDVPHEKTPDGIADDLNAVAPVARDLGQCIALEAHNAPGTLEDMKYVMDRVKDKKALGIRSTPKPARPPTPTWRSSSRWSRTCFPPPCMSTTCPPPRGYPNQLVVNVMATGGWDGWVLLETSGKVPDRVAAQREVWEQMVAASGAAYATS